LRRSTSICRIVSLIRKSELRPFGDRGVLLRLVFKMGPEFLNSSYLSLARVGKFCFACYTNRRFML
jgi:hypothetical protein